MSTKGYSGREYTVELGGTKIAAIETKSTAMARESIDVTTDDASGWTTLLPTPGNRNVNQTIEGVATSANYQLILAEWFGNVLSDITIKNADGSTMSAADGFFLGNLEFSGEQNGRVGFTGQLMSSGEVTLTAPPA